MNEPSSSCLSSDCHFCHKPYPNTLNMMLWYGAPYGQGVKWLACPYCHDDLEEYRKIRTEGLTVAQSG